MIGIVLDTNVVVSAFLNDEGAEATVVDLVLTREVEFFASEAILNEYKLVLTRPKFSLTLEQVDALMAALRAGAVMVEPAETLTALSDEPDNCFLVCRGR